MRSFHRRVFGKCGLTCNRVDCIFRAPPQRKKCPWEVNGRLDAGIDRISALRLPKLQVRASGEAKRQQKTLMEAIGSTNWREHFSGEEPQSETTRSNDPKASRA